MCPFVSPSCGHSPGLKRVCLVAVLSGFECFYDFMFFGKDRPQSEGRRYADLGIKTEPATGYGVPQCAPQHKKYTILGRVSRRDGVVPTQGEDCTTVLPLGWFESNEGDFQKLGRSSKPSIFDLLTRSPPGLARVRSMLMCEAEHPTGLMDYGRSGARSEFGLNQENRSDIPFLRVRGVALWSNFGDGKPCERANWSFVCTFSIKTNLGISERAATAGCAHCS